MVWSVDLDALRNLAWPNPLKSLKYNSTVEKPQNVFVQDNIGKIPVFPW